MNEIQTIQRRPANQKPKFVYFLVCCQLLFDQLQRQAIARSLVGVGDHYWSSSACDTNLSDQKVARMEMNV